MTTLDSSLSLCPAPQVRLAEISEQLCKDVGRGETQCHVNHGDWEEDIEDWWRLDPATRWVITHQTFVPKSPLSCVTTY